MPRADPSFLRQLANNGTPYRDPLTELDWSAARTDTWWLPPCAVSVAGIPEFEALPEATRKRLSRYEFVAFIQAGLWVEAIFMERLARALPRTGSDDEYALTLHEIREEAGHSLMFLALMEHTGIRLPAAWQRRPQWLTRLGRWAPVESLVFRLAVAIGEEVPDKVNRLTRTSAETADPLIRALCTLHVRDEARHIAHARAALAARLHSSGRLRRAWAGCVAGWLIRRFVNTFFLPAPEVYELAGLAPGHTWRARARKNPARRAFVSRCVGPTLNLLADHDVTVSRTFP